LGCGEVCLKSKENCWNSQYEILESSTYLKAICLFRETAQWELVSLGINTALTSYKCTGGVSPLNPFALAWAESIETLMMKENGEIIVSYEIIAKKGAPELSGDDKEVLHSALLGELYDNMLNSNIAILLEEQILAKWRKGIEEGVRELNDYNDFARANLPSNVPFSDTEHALKTPPKLICLRKSAFRV
jgi:hypothetical protein